MQHAQNTPHAVHRHSQRQRAAHVAQGSVCVFFLGGGLSLKSPTTQQSTAEGGGFQARFPDHTAISKMCSIFFCGTPPVRLCWAQTGHYMSDRHNTPLLYNKETGISTTYCDATRPAPVEKKSLSALKLPKREPAKRAANSDAPGTRRGPAIPDSVPQAGRKNPLTSHPPAVLRLLALPPLYNSWMSPSVILPSEAVSVLGVPSGSTRRSGESRGSSFTHTGACRTRKTGCCPPKEGKNRDQCNV